MFCNVFVCLLCVLTLQGILVQTRVVVVVGKAMWSVNIPSAREVGHYTAGGGQAQRLGLCKCAGSVPTQRPHLASQ